MPRSDVAINYQRMRILSAADGDLPIGYAAYMARSRYRSSVTGDVFDYRHHVGLIWEKVFLPDGADPRFEHAEVLWNSMTRAEIRKTPRRKGDGKLTKSQFAALIARIDDPGKEPIDADDMKPAWREDAQLAYVLETAAPKELGADQLRAMFTAYVEEVIRPYGFACQVALHTPDNDLEPNVHAHILIATREIDGTKIGNKIRGPTGRFAGRTGHGTFLAESGFGPDAWAAWQNQYFHRMGLDLRVDPKSASPGQHVGTGMWVRGGDLLKQYREDKEEGRSALKDPEIVLGLLTENWAAFAESDVHALLARSKMPPDEVSRVLQEFQNLADLRPLFDARTGSFTGKFTSRQARDQERRIATLAEKLAGKPGRPGSRPTPAPTHPRSRLTLIESPDEAYQIRLLHQVQLEAGPNVIPLAATPPIAFWMECCGFPGTHTVEQELLQHSRSRTSSWGRSTCVLVNEANLLTADQIEALLALAAETGARMVLVGNGRCGGLGRGDSLAIVRAIAGTRQDSADTPVRSLSAPGLPAGIGLPSLAFDAPGDRRPPLRSRPPASPGVVREVVKREFPAPRAWRWPGRSAGLCDLYNLSSRPDCDRLEAALNVLEPDDLLAIHAHLPGISDSGSNPNQHPLAMLHRRLRGRLRRAGFDPVLRRVDSGCLLGAGVDSEDSWRERPDLAPRNGHVDTRPLLADVSLIDNDDWRKLQTHMAPHPASVLCGIVEGLDDLFERAGKDDDRHAISFARLQILIMAKDSGRDLVPETSREALWSLISSADRIRRGLRFHERGTPGKPILAQTLASTGVGTPEEQRGFSTDPLRQAKATPLWLRPPAWQSFKDYGVDPDGRGGTRERHFRAVCRATSEERATYQAALLEIWKSCQNLAGRAWVAVGLQHLASWHRQNGKVMPEEFAEADEESNFAVLAWRQNGGSGRDGSPFTRARKIVALRDLAGQLSAATDRDRQLKLAERLLRFKRHAQMPSHYNDLVAASTDCAIYLRSLDSSRMNPLVLGQLMDKLRDRLAADLGDDAALVPQEPNVKRSAAERIMPMKSTPAAPSRRLDKRRPESRQL